METLQNSTPLEATILMSNRPSVVQTLGVKAVSTVAFDSSLIMPKGFQTEVRLSVRSVAGQSQESSVSPPTVKEPSSLVLPANFGQSE